MKTITAKQFYSGYDPGTGEDITVEEGESVKVSDEKFEQLQSDGFEGFFDFGKKGSSKSKEPAPEPYEGYADADAGARVEKIESGELSLDQLQAIKADQDAAKKPQKSVVTAVDAAIEAAQAAEEGSGD